MTHEFDAIRQFFQHRVPLQQATTSLGNGDDASVHGLPTGMELVVSTDAAVSGVHWPVDMPLDIAAKRALCAALSDLAAMGAEATWIWLSVVAKDMPSLQAISDGVVDVCQTYQLELAGGDTVQAPLDMLNVTVAGLLPQASAMTRQAAQVGDEIWLLGNVGLSAYGLQRWWAGERDGPWIDAFQTVVPLLKQGVQLREMGVRCCMDVSDGLLQDAGHLAQASGVLLSFDLVALQALPAYALLLEGIGEDAQQGAVLPLILAGGEDFSLLFTAKPALRSELEALSACRLGVCRAGQGVELMDKGENMDIQAQGYGHFG